MHADVSPIDDRVTLRAPMLFLPVVLLGCGFLYSVVGAVLGGIAFPHAASGSLVERDGKAVGSALVAQPFQDARYFMPRPSAANYDPMAAAGSNMARSNPELRKRIADSVAAVAARDGVDPARVPSDLVTQSASGLDPDISPEAARLQVMRVARMRGMPAERVATLVAANTQGPQFGVLGRPRVNVLALNLALDAASSE